MNISTKFIMIILLSLQYLPLSSQNDILIFEEGEPFFNVEIERIIRNLKDKSNKDNLLFRHVMSKRGLENHIAYQINIDTLADKFFSTINEPSKLVTNTRNSISKSLSKLTHVLTMRVTPFDDLLEFQLILFKKVDDFENVIDSTYQNYSELLTAFDQVYKKAEMANFFISPKESDHNLALERAIKKLFPQSNLNPSLEILVGNRLFEQDRTYTYNLGDTITLDASYSYDRDSKKKNLAYEWEQLQAGNKNLVFDKFNPMIRISPTVKGKYYLSVQVGDGISSPISNIIKLEIIEPLDAQIKNDWPTHIYTWDFLNKKKDNFKINDFELHTNYALNAKNKLSFSLRKNEPLEKVINELVAVRYPIDSIVDNTAKIVIEEDTVQFRVFDDRLYMRRILHSNNSAKFKSYNKYKLDLFYNESKVEEIDIDKQLKFKLNGPIRLKSGYNFSFIYFDRSKLNTTTLNPANQALMNITGSPDSIRRGGFRTRETEIVLHKNIKFSFLNKGELYRDNFSQELYLDSFQTSITIPYSKSLHYDGGYKLSLSTALHKIAVGLEVSLNKYYFSDRTPSKNQLKAIEFVINDLGKVPETEEEIRTATGLGYFVGRSFSSPAPDETYTNLTTTERTLGLGINIHTPIFKLPIYINAGYYHSFSHKNLPFDKIDNISLGVSVDFLGLMYKFLNFK